MCAQKTTASSGGCPEEERASVACTSEILGSKWMPQLVFALSYGVNRFTELQEQSGGPNPRTLSARLDELEKFGIVSKAVYPEAPPRVEYALTDKGKDLVPILRAMVDWGKKYNRVDC
jgi:DNA-binding HxlR family transcriptional regulator